MSCLILCCLALPGASAESSVLLLAFHPFLPCNPKDAVEEAPEETTAAVADVSAPDDFSDLKKKKKKSSKKAAFDLEAFERELAEDGPAAAGAGGVEDDEGAEGAVPEYGENELGENVFGSGAGADIPEDGDDSAMPWAGSDRDYTYDEVRLLLLRPPPTDRRTDSYHLSLSLSQLLSRAFRILRSQNPELAGDRRRYTIAPPQMLRDGNKKTIFANLADICKRMHRSDEHVISFLYAELGTSGSVDGSHRLIIKGRYTQKHMENVLRKYIGQSFLPSPRISCLFCRTR